MNKVIYLLLCIILTVVGFVVFNYSMNEPFTVVTKKDLIWQLVVPAMCFASTLVAILVGLNLYKTSPQIAVGTIFLLFIDALIFFEAIYGYLWDLTTHAGVS